jgi:hypothetical protein
MFSKLFGPRWNTSVPRFAANLGFSPLEPMRASQSSPTPLEPAKELPQVDPTTEVGRAVAHFFSRNIPVKFQTEHL